MATIFDVAKYILTKRGETMVWKLQKLCYYAQAWHLVWSDGDALFEEDFYAWANGPVCRELYDFHKGIYTISADDLTLGDINNLSEDEADSVDVILKDLGDNPPFWFREQSRSELPWIDASAPEFWIDGTSTPELMSELKDMIITKKAMRTYYGGL